MMLSPAEAADDVKAIRAAMGKKKMSGRALSRALKMSDTMVAAYLRGASGISSDRIAAMRAAVGIKTKASSRQRH